MTQTTMQFTEGTEVWSADGNNLGKIERLVVDPRTKQVSHLVLSKGFFFPEERVVPVDFVAVANDKVVTLHERVDVSEFPPFEETYYLQIDEDTTRRHYPSSATSPLVWGYPAFGAMAPGVVYSNLMARPQKIPRVDRNIPSNEVPVATGARVLTADAEEIGKVTGAKTTDDGALVSIDVDPGWFRDERSIPAHFVGSMDDDVVRLEVTSATLDAWRARH